MGENEMKIFTVEQGTAVRMIEDGREWFGDRFIHHITNHDNAFDLEEMCVDPVMPFSTWCCTRYDTKTVGGYWAECGWYGFRRDGWVMMIPANKVTMLS